ncbi:MAG: CRISPR-associated endonuclease Cas2 [Acetobacteraceae bacterium]
MARSPSLERVYIVTYDIGDPKRWRRVFRAMNGYGRWLQLSVFQCRLTARRRAELGASLERLIKREEDHVVIIDVGPADAVNLAVGSLGRPFTPIVREAIVI